MPTFERRLGLGYSGARGLSCADFSRMIQIMSRQIQAVAGVLQTEL